MNIAASPSLQAGDTGDTRNLRRVAFLYNHDAGHQVRHSAAVIPELIKRYPTAEITVLATSDSLFDVVRQVAGSDIDHRCSFVRLKIPIWHRPFARLADTVLPFSRIDHLYCNKSILAKFDALIVTEGTSLFLKKLKGLEHLKIIRIDHGGGDRSIGFQPSFSGNDLVLLPGVKQRNRYLELGYLREDQIAVVGYSKFDAVNIDIAARSRVFADDKPIVLYNPHPEPHLSSWYSMGLEILEYFYNSEDYNLIFAPHVMLFLRRIHISSEWFAARLRRNLPEKYFKSLNILVDMGSEASLDMTYTLTADIYIGDVSSQIYEFLIKPRPCILLNSHHANWRGNPNYAFWNFGPVIDSVAELDAYLRNAQKDHGKYRPIQEVGFKTTFDQQPTAASVRAADAIAAFLGVPETY